MFPDLRNNLKSSGSLLHKRSITYSTMKRSFAPRILTTTSEGILRMRYRLFPPLREYVQMNFLIYFQPNICTTANSYQSNNFNLPFSTPSLRNLCPGSSKLNPTYRCHQCAHNSVTKHWNNEHSKAYMHCSPSDYPTKHSPPSQ
jgi:hypothetical protein